MRFSQAYDPFRALPAAWKILIKAPLTMLVGGLLMLIADGGCNTGTNYSDGGHMSEEEVVLFLIVGAVCCLLGIALWLFGALVMVGFA